MQDDIKSLDDHAHADTGNSSKADSSMSQRRQIVKQAKNSSNAGRRFIFQFSFIVILILAYFSSMFGIARYFITSIEMVTSEMRTVTQTEAFMSFL